MITSNWPQLTGRLNGPKPGMGNEPQARDCGLAGLNVRPGMLDWAWNESAGASWRWPHGINGPSAASLPNHPVTQISGLDAEAYCRWVGGRLPTIEEWEVAARAGASTRWPLGDKYIPARAN